MLFEEVGDGVENMRFEVDGAGTGGFSGAG
jgi:hypothetical protein